MDQDQATTETPVVFLADSVTFHHTECDSELLTFLDDVSEIEIRKVSAALANPERSLAIRTLIADVVNEVRAANP